ncbi:TetR/AcrR family transcriptional regulator [Nocardiopsis ansamitocini]|nr:TetR/AcrR family transcriptional regulator [Nocardiopsis ansamitocini]
MRGQPIRAGTRGQRSDACRNHEQIIRAATELLAASPGAGMDELTAATGLGRTTVYRHFHAREQLVAEVYATAFSGTQRLVAEAGLQTCPQDELLDRAVAVAMRAVQIYPVLVNGPGLNQDTVTGSAESGYGACLDELAGPMARAQEAGLLDPALPPRWLAGVLLNDCVGAVLFSAELRDSRLGPAELVRLAFARAWAAPI